MQLAGNRKIEHRGENIVFLILLVAMVSLAFSIRFLNSISIGVLFMFPIVHPERKQFIKNAFGSFYFIAILGLFFLQIAGILYATDKAAGWQEVMKKAGIVAIPFFFCAFGPLSATIMKRLMIAFSVSLVLVSLYCLSHSFVLYTQHHDASVFFYHRLLQPFDHHAVFFSFFLFFCIVYWTAFVQHRSVWINAMLVFFAGMIFLLSSKLVIILTVVYCIYFIIKAFNAGRIKLILLSMLAIIIVMIAVVVITNNPIKDRFKDVANGSYTLFEKDQFSPAVYFNGVQFRLLIWRFTGEILDIKNDWALGVSPGDAQHELNKKYVEANMYLGDGKGDTGLLNYNCHNVFLQTLLESGVIGLLFLIIAIVSFLSVCIRRRKLNTLFFFGVIVIYGFAESLLSGQYEILLFTFFPLLSFSGEAEN